MPSLGNLYVTLGAKADGLDQAISSAKKNLGNLSDVARSTAKTVALVGTAAVGAGASIIVGLVNSGRQAIDVQAKLAQSLDGTIGGLRAAEMALGDAGVATNDFYSAATRMNAALGGAHDAASPAAKALESIGLSAEYLLSLDIDQRFAAIADAMAQHNLNGASAQSIMRDLGVRSENLANAMRQGGDAFREQANEVDRLGLRLSMVDAAQVELANDSIGVFGDVLTGIQDRLTVTAAPYITVLAEKFREAAIESEGFKGETESAISSLIIGFGKAADYIQAIRTVFKGVELAAVGFGAAVISQVQLVMEAYSKLNEGTTEVGNKFIRLANKLGADLDLTDPFTNSPFMQGLRGMAEESRNHVGTVRGEFHEMAMSFGQYSAAATDYLNEVAEASKKSAEAVVAARASSGGVGLSGIADTGGGEGDKAAEALAKKNEMELEAVKNRFMTEEQLLAEHRELMGIIGSEYDATKFESEEQWRSITEQAEAEHLARMTELNRQAYDGIAGIIEQKWGKGAATTANAFKSILNTAATGSRKAFEISKAWALGDALVSTYQGIAAGVKLGYPAAIPAVAAAAAVGFAQVSAIKNQSFGGGGGAAASGGGAPATAPNPVNVGGDTGQAGGSTGSGQSVALQIDPDAIITGRGIISMLEQAVNNGANISFLGAN